MKLALSEASVDDMLQEILDRLMCSTEIISPSKGQAKELRGVSLELLNARARLSRSETRGRLFSSLGELCWYLSGSGKLGPIEYYVPRYRQFAVGEEVPGAYGPRLLAFDGFNQLHFVIEKLKDNPSTRRAVVQLFDHSDSSSGLPEVPCTCTLQFFIRNSALELVVYMRSNDVYLGFPHDVFAFTMIQEIIARATGVRLGNYVHMIGSLHLYDHDYEAAKSFLAEGWQSSVPMPPMPSGDPWSSIQWLLGVEEQLRLSENPLQIDLAGPNEYWSDIAKLLAIYALKRRGRPEDIQPLQSTISSRSFDVYIQDSMRR